MEDFLGKSKHCLDQLERLKSVHVVLGNEACDLDSVISSLVYAYFLQLSLPHDEERAIVPVLNIPHADFRLRTEVTFALERQGLGDKLLTFRNQVDLHNLHRSGKLSLHLVDHHVLPPGDQVLEESLVEILDHRKLERDEKVGVSMTVEMVGSCATLVAEKMFSDPKIAIPLEVYHLFYETILLDTVCMAPSAGRGTPRDEAVLARLEDQLPNHSRQLTFDTVNAARGDISRLTTLEVLRKDLKVVGAGSMRVAMSSITGNIKDFLARDDVITSLKGFCLQQESHVVVVMAITMDGGREPERQLAVYSSDQPIREQVVGHLAGSSDPGLGLVPLRPTPSHTVVAFEQTNVKASRKAVLPLVRAWLEAQEQAKQEL